MTEAGAAARPPECPDCGEPMEMVDVPHERVVGVPFTRTELRIVTWGAEPWCGWCARDPEQDLIESVANEAETAGYEQGYEAAAREFAGDGY